MLILCLDVSQLLICEPETFMFCVTAIMINVLILPNHYVTEIHQCLWFFTSCLVGYDLLSVIGWFHTYIYALRSVHCNLNMFRYESFDILIPELQSFQWYKLAEVVSCLNCVQKRTKARPLSELPTSTFWNRF